MKVAVFVLPMIGTGSGPTEDTPAGDPHRPAYVDTRQVESWGALRFGRTDNAIVKVEAGQDYLEWLDDQPDALLLATSDTIDQPLDQAGVDQWRAALDVYQIPTHWLEPGETRREMIRGLAGMFCVSQRFEGQFRMNFRQRMQHHGATPETAWRDLGDDFRMELLQVALSFGWLAVQPPLSDIGAATPLRDLLKAMGDRFQRRGIVIGGLEI